MSQASIVSAHADGELPGFPPSSQVAQYEQEPTPPSLPASAAVARHNENDEGDEQIKSSTSTAAATPKFNASTANLAENTTENTQFQPRPSNSPTPVPQTQTQTHQQPESQEQQQQQPPQTTQQERPAEPPTIIEPTPFHPPAMNISSSMLSEVPTEVDPIDHAESLMERRREEDITPPSSIQPQSTQLPAEPVVPNAPVQGHTQTEPAAAKTPSGDVVTPPNMQVPGSPGNTAGSKRTATGMVKGLSSSLPNTPHLSGKSSADKARIGELSSTLKTRLSYAMMKVQKGWQTQTIDQVEESYATARQIGLSRSPSMNMSPGSAQSDPATRMGGLKREYSGDVITHDTARLNESQMTHASEIVPIEQHSQYHMAEQHRPPPSLTPQSSFSSVTGERTYESFWRDHTANPHTAKYLAARGYTSPPNAHVNLPPMSDSQSSRHLAPAAPIGQYHQPPPPPQPRPSFAERRGRRVAPPPTLPQQSISNVSAVSNFSTATTEFPITPTRPTTLTMEQDAVESLMFLSSPGHSQKTAPSSQQQPRPQQPPQRSLPASQVQAQSALIKRVWQSTGPGSSGGAETDDDGDSFMGDANAPISEDDLDRELDNDALHRNEDDDDDDEEEESYEYRRRQHGGGSGTSIPRRESEASAHLHEHRIKRIKQTIEGHRVKQAEQNRLMAATAAGKPEATMQAPTIGHITSPRPRTIMAGDMGAVRPVS